MSAQQDDKAIIAELLTIVRRHELTIDKLTSEVRRLQGRVDQMARAVRGTANDIDGIYSELATKVTLR